MTLRGGREPSAYRARRKPPREAAFGVPGRPLGFGLSYRGSTRRSDLAVTSPEQAIEKLRWYAQRWKIELFHKVLKSGCRVEAARLRTAERLTKLIAVFCILGWRIFWTTMINRTAPDAPPRSALTEAEITVIDRAVRDRPTIPVEKTLAHYLMKVACLGGYLARARDPPPGNTVMWRGWSRLMDMMLGADLMQPNCG